MIIEDGAETEVRSHQKSDGAHGETQMLCAAFSYARQSSENLKILIQCGASVHVTDGYGNGSFHSFFDDIISLLLACNEFNRYTKMHKQGVE